MTATGHGTTQKFLKMPYSKDIRCGQGWFEINVNWFYDYLDTIDEELILQTGWCQSDTDYHNRTLEEEIESRVNEYISWKVFGEKRNKLDEDDLLPDFFEDDIWGYVYHHICMLVRRKPTWYELRSTLPDESEESESEDGVANCEECSSQKKSTAE